MTHRPARIVRTINELGARPNSIRQVLESVCEDAVRVPTRRLLRLQQLHEVVERQRTLPIRIDLVFGTRRSGREGRDIDPGQARGR